MILRYLLRCLAFGILALVSGYCAVSLAGGVPALASSGQWDNSSIAADPPVVNLARQHQVTLTVSLVNAGPGVAEDVLLACTAERGEILSASGAYRIGEYALWAQDVPAGATTFTFTARPATWPTMSAPCWVYDDGELQYVFTGTVGVEPLQVYLPLVARALSSTTIITVPLRFVVGRSVAMPPSWRVAFEAAGYFLAADGVYVQAVNYVDDYTYWIDRAFLLAQIPDLMGRKVVSAGAWFFAAPTSRNTVAIHAGEWLGSNLPELPRHWQGYGEVEGTVMLEYNLLGWYPLEIPLDPTGFAGGQAWKGVLRALDDIDAALPGPHRGMFVAAGDCARLPPSASEGCFEPYLRLVVADR